VISSSPAIIRSSVDLPQPDGPTSTQNCPSSIATSTPRITGVVPNCLWTPAMVTAAMEPPRPCNGRRARRAWRNASWCCPELRLARAADDDVLGPPGGEPRNDVLRRLPPQLALGLDRVE